jgi:hypothetical protein
MVGLGIRGIQRLNGNGAVRGCTSVDVDHLGADLREEGIRRAAVLITPLILGSDGVSDDVSKFAALGEAGIPLTVAYQKALDLAATDEHRELRWLVADKLMTTLSITFDVPITTAEELCRVLR